MTYARRNELRYYEPDRLREIMCLQYARRSELRYYEPDRLREIMCLQKV